MPLESDIDGVAARWFSRWRSGKMHRGEQAALNEWLAASRRHRAAYESLELLWLRLEVTRAAPRVLQWRERACRKVSVFHKLRPLRGLLAWHSRKKCP
jgi:ferric-dicitrate binding protein FerR (iron transport regulator)